VRGAQVVLAREVEVPESGDAGSSGDGDASSDRPELYFCDDLLGYGWVFRKRGYLNIGLGRFGERGLAEATKHFVDWLSQMGRVTGASRAWRWHGHAYAVWRGTGSMTEAVPDDGVLLVGDALGIAYAESGEGIRPAVESGILAADVILQASGQYSRVRLASYGERVIERFGTSRWGAAIGRLIPGGLSASLGARLLSVPWFVRRVVLDRWFLHAAQPALARR
jgi:flavin-dependent dehydrogenase